MPKTCCKKRNQTANSSEKKSAATSCCKKVSICGDTKVEYSDDESDAHCCNLKSNKKTKIVAEVNVGFGNALYIRGAGYGLDWDKGIALKNQDSNFWIYEIDSCGQDFEYKLLINDETWSTGDNFIAHHNKHNIVSPEF